MAKVVIGVDPHKRINAVCVLNGKGEVVARQQFANTAGGFRELRKLAEGKSEKEAMRALIR